MNTIKTIVLGLLIIGLFFGYTKRGHASTNNFTSPINAVCIDPNGAILYHKGKLQIVLVKGVPYRFNRNMTSVNNCIIISHD